MTLFMALNTLVDRYGRYTVDIASTASSFGFAAAKAGTRLGVRLFLSLPPLVLLLLLLLTN